MLIYIALICNGVNMGLREFLQLRLMTQEELAHAVGVTQPMVSFWVSGACRITAERAVLIERATGGMVSRKDLRPDLFDG